MMVFYRKYRPQKLADLIGQEHIKETLLAQLTSGKISHGYLFAGPKGTGKTSTARILAKAVNCQGLGKLGKLGTREKLDSRLYELDPKFGEPCNKCQSCISITNGSYLDLVEIDAASNRGIDEIRDLREKIKLSPVSGRFKVYIIDEAQMLTMEAFNALLKTLEEPPGHVIFILCTTAASKLPSTIVSRLTRFNFRAATHDDLIKASLKVAKLEGIKIEDEAASAIAKAADGSFRDAMTILDQLSVKRAKITASDVVRVATVSGQGSLLNFIEALVARDLRGAVLTVEQLAKDNFDIALFGREVVLILEKILLIKIGIPQLSSVDQKLIQIANSLTLGDLTRMMKLFLIAEGEAKIYPLAKIPLILAACKYCGDDVGPAAVARGPVASFLPAYAKASAGKLASEGSAALPLEAKRSGVGNPSTGATPRTSPRITHESRAKSRDGGTKGLLKLEKKWGEFLEKVKGSNIHLFALLRSTKPTEFDGENLNLMVFFRFHKEKLEEPKIRIMLENLLKEVMGAKINLRFSLASRDSQPPKIVDRSDVVEAGEDLARIAQEIFSK